MKGVKYVGPVYDMSGYGEACRNYIYALHRAGIDLTVQPRRFEMDPPPCGTQEERELIDELVQKPIDYDKVIVHLTPDLAPEYKEKERDKYFINYTVWETSLLHPLWARACNMMDEVWVPSEWNVEAFRASGVNVPMLKINHGINIDAFDGSSDKFSISSIPNDYFTFYSIFQWNARKNPEGLLRAYFNAFNVKDKVALVLKTYVGGGMSADREKSFIKEQVLRIKRDMGFDMNSYPKVVLVSDKLSSDSMKGLHKFCDVYVTLHHGEGFGLTSFEAGLAGNPVISTGMGGNMEYMTAENTYLVDYQWNFVRGMSSFNPWYLGNQQWGEPNIVDAAVKMRYVYDHREEAAEKGLVLQKDIKNKFSWDQVAQKMINRLKEIDV